MLGRRAMAAVAVAVVAVVAGCDATFGLIDVHNPPDGPPGADALSVMCGSAAELQDNFDGNSLDVGRWITVLNGGSSITAVGGEVVLDLGAGTVADQTTAQLLSYDQFDFTGHQVSVELTRLSNPASGLQANLLLVAPGGSNAVAISVESGRMGCGARESGVFRQLCFSSAFDPVKQRFWAIRESMGQLHLDLSPDRVTWTELMSYTPPFALTDMAVGLYVYLNAAEDDPGQAAFDNFVMCKQP
jgi:hypothetical protein